MPQAPTYIARPIISGTWSLLVDGVNFGTVFHGWFGPYKGYQVELRDAYDNVVTALFATLAEALAYAREHDENMCDDADKEAAFELSCEGAWLRAAEYDPEAQADLAREEG